jgi:hypothetical protein
MAPLYELKAMAGRPRTPDEIHELNGSWLHNPKRRRPKSPKSELTIGNPPEHLTEAEAKISATGALVSSDRLILARLCELESKVRMRTANTCDYTQHLRILSLLGFTPADRPRMSTMRGDQDDNPFA